MAKPLTAYIQSTADNLATKWTLNSTTVTLNSTLVRLSGYFIAITPNQISNKPLTAYTAA